MTWRKAWRVTLPEPILATPVPGPALQPGWAGEPKWDGFRALMSVDAGRVVLRSRRGTEMAPAFPEVVAGAERHPRGGGDRSEDVGGQQTLGAQFVPEDVRNGAP
jgi:ribosomal protein L34